MEDASSSILEKKDVIMTSLLLLKIIYVSRLPRFYQRPYYLSIFRFMSTLRKNWILLINLTT